MTRRWTTARPRTAGSSPPGAGRAAGGPAGAPGSGPAPHPLPPAPGRTAPARRRSPEGGPRGAAGPLPRSVGRSPGWSPGPARAAMAGPSQCRPARRPASPRSRAPRDRRRCRRPAATGLARAPGAASTGPPRPPCLARSLRCRRSIRRARAPRWPARQRGCPGRRRRPTTPVDPGRGSVAPAPRPPSICPRHRPR
jgi:hypothetical protein